MTARILRRSMEIDCSEKFDENKTNVAKELDLFDEKLEKGEFIDKEQKDMVANTQDGAETKRVELTDDVVAGVMNAESTKDGGSNNAKSVSKVTKNQDCDNQKIDKSEEEKSSEDLNSSLEENVEKEPSDDLLVPMEEYADQDIEEVEEEECEISSPLKGADNDDDDVDDDEDAELSTDTDEFNQDDMDEEEYRTRKAVDNAIYEVESNQSSAKGTDLSDDVEIVGDSSDEDDIHDSQDASSRNQGLSTSDDDDDYDYDDDDLMNDVIMSRTVEEKKKEKLKETQKIEIPRQIEISRKKEPEIFKRKLRWDYRIQLKKRSVRWLIKKIHKEPMTGAQYMCRSRPEITTVKQQTKIASTPIKSSQREVEVISIDLDDSPEKSAPSTSPILKQLKEPSSTTAVKPKPNFDMQQVDKIRDSIQNAEELKQQQHVKALKDDQNKENVENNDKLLSNSLKLNGSVEGSSKADEKTKENNEKGDKIEIMDISTEDDDKTLESTILKEPTGDKSGLDEEKDGTERSKKDATGIEIKETMNDDNEAVPVQIIVCDGRNETTPDKSNSKDSQLTDLKKAPSAKRPRSASLDDTTKQEDVHPTKKLRAELESNFPTHDRILSEYIEKTSNNSVDEIQKHISQLIIEIQTLNDMIKAKEIEWNNMLHLKKVKEEICFRLSRKKQMMDIISTKVGEAVFPTSDDPINETILQNPSTKTTKLIASTPNVSTVTPNFSSSVLNNLSNASATPGNNSLPAMNTSGSTAQSILQNRANMKSSDLAKEKANTQRLHRNILPKPSSSSSAAVAGFGGSPQVSVPTVSTSSATAGTMSAAGMANIPLSLPSGLGSLGLTSNGTLGSQQQPILNSYLTAAATVQQQLGEMLNGHHNPLLNQQINTNGSQTLMVGRQGVFKDVKSIIADYRQRHPEAVPRRGRRVKSNPSATDSSSILSNVLKNDGKLSSSDLGALLTKFDGNSRPSSNDSSHSMTNLIGSNTNNTNLGSVSFKDVLVQFAKMSGQTDRLGTVAGSKLLGNTTTTTGSGSQSAPPPYPEVTLHPVSTTQSSVDQTGSLLHGILTKYTRPNVTSTPSAAPTSTSQSTASQNFSSTFSPTLARLLTAPERINTSHNAQTTSSSYQSNLQAVQSAVAGSGLNLSKVVGHHNSEITITPVISSQPLQQTLLQQQLQHQQQQLKDAIRDRVKGENLLNLDDEADDSVDRLVIDEGGDSAGIDEHHRIAPHAIGQEFHENEVPACQGCKKQEAQFVCAGCGNQWYCSRECQVAAWDEHSEVCTG